MLDQTNTPFGATIVGFQKGDIIQTGVPSAIQDGYYTPSYNTTTHTLTITGDGGQQAQLIFAGNYILSDFQFSYSYLTSTATITTTSTANSVAPAAAPAVTPLTGDADPQFDAAYYLAANPDVAAAGADPYTHFLTYGWREGRNPSANFSTSDYLAANPDVAKAGIDPLLHYEDYGQAEGRAAFEVTSPTPDPLVNAPY